MIDKVKDIMKMKKLAGISVILNEEDRRIVSKEGKNYKDFAKEVAEVLKDEYGSHLYKKFIETLVAELQIKIKIIMNEDLRNSKDNPCWRGYHPVGTKKEDGKTVPNCVPIDETDQYCTECLKEYITEHWNRLEEAEHHGRKVRLGKPFLTPDGPKKRSVYVKNAKGNVIKVNFGDPNMRIKKSSPKHRKSFRARHHCENPGPRTKANYWSCRAW